MLHEDAEQTVIRVTQKDTHMLLGESLVACIMNMPMVNVDEELRRHHRPITGSPDSRRNRLVAFMCSELGKFTGTTGTNETSATNHHLSGIERTLIDKVDSINALSDEISALKQELLQLSPSQRPKKVLHLVLKKTLNFSKSKIFGETTLKQLKFYNPGLTVSVMRL